ncbi:MAG: BBP7 family outer membrane beta-barrel protein [Planctomycetes bacterium]|nr:BBP7 family outer membrane beta-barrel protein [Planctomycetota bacterium]
MTIHKIRTWLVAGLLLSTTSTVARGQVNEWVNTPAHDLQFYSPVDFDFDDRPLRRADGFIFRYDKLSWAFTGERYTLGDPGRTVQSEIIYRDPADVAPDPYDIPNGIQNSPPRAEFGWGERYELGLFNQGNGWLVGILDGPKAVSSETYGFGPGSGLFDTNNPNVTDNRGIDPFFLDPDGGWDDDGNGIPDGDGPTDAAQALGFGSVHINFAADDGFFFGFRNYLINNQGAMVGTVTGPILYVGNVGTSGDAFIDDDPDLGNLGLVDDLDFDGNFGVEISFVDTNMNGVQDDDEPTLTLLADFGDLHEFNVAFDRVNVRNTTQTDGIEIMRTFDLSNRHMMVKHQNNRLSIAYGARYLRLRDRFAFVGEGSILGMTSVDQRIDNNIVGPQIHARWDHQKGRFLWTLDGRCLLGYNVSNWDQVGLFGQELVPGGMNRLLYGQPTSSAYGRQDNDFSPVVELRAETSYQITNAIAWKLGYTALFVDNIHRAASTVRWRAPDWGFLTEGTQEIFINGVNFGFEAVY